MDGHVPEPPSPADFSGVEARPLHRRRRHSPLLSAGYTIGAALIMLAWAFACIVALVIWGALAEILLGGPETGPLAFLAGAGCSLGSGIAGAALGQRRDCMFEGLLLGFLFGPVGLAISLSIDRRPQCPACREHVNWGATRCQHCLVSLESYDGW